MIRGARNILEFDRGYLDLLACPRDRSPLRIEGKYLVSELEGHRYPIVEGIPVMLVDDVAQTMGLADQSIQAARKYVDGECDDPWFLDTLAVGEKEKQTARQLTEQADAKVDPVVSVALVASSGQPYRSVLGRLDRYPIPELRLEAGVGQRLLDIGCNWGRWSIAAARKGYSVVGIDPSLAAVLAAARLARKEGLDIRLIVADARHIPIKDNQFDVVFSYSVLQHFARADVAMALEQIRRVLKPTGKSVIQMASWQGVRSLMHLARRGFREGTGFNVRYWSVNELRCFFAAHLGPTQTSVDCFFGLGLQYSDRHLMSKIPRAASTVSEFLRFLSLKFHPLVYCADSVYVTSTIIKQ